MIEARFHGKNYRSEKGWEVEDDLLGGKAPLTDEGKEKLELIKKEKRYLSRNDSMNLIEDYYDASTAEHDSDWENDLHFLLAEELGVENSEIKIYNATGTPLDTFHGVDFYVQFSGHTITVDITFNPNKASGYKADVILYWDPKIDKVDNFSQYESGLEYYARLIANQFKKQITYNSKTAYAK